jgi:hypothetical protein
MDELNGTTYLDYVIRETLRLHIPVPNTARVPTWSPWAGLSLTGMEPGGTNSGK